MAGDSGRVGDQIEGAYAEGKLSRESTQALASIGDGVGTQLARTLGEQEATSEDLLLAAILIDDSPSIGTIAGGPEAVMQGHNFCLEALEDELPSGGSGAGGGGCGGSYGGSSASGELPSRNLLPKSSASLLQPGARSSAFRAFSSS